MTNFETLPFHEKDKLIKANFFGKDTFALTFTSELLIFFSFIIFKFSTKVGKSTKMLELNEMFYVNL